MSLKNYNSALADSVTCNNYAPSSAIFTFSLLIQSTQHSLFIVLLILFIIVFIILTWRFGHHGWRSYFWLLFVLRHFLEQKQYYCSFTTGVSPRITCFFPKALTLKICKSKNVPIGTKLWLYIGLHNNCDIRLHIICHVL